VEPLERLSAYLADELDAAARAAVDVELARDPGLRAQLDAMRRADRVLAGARGPRPPSGFDDRLRTAIDAELDRLIGDGDRASESSPAGDAGTDTRRPWGARLGERFRWAPALAGAAAGVVLLAGVGLVVSDRFSTDGLDDEVAADMTLESADDPASSLALPEGAERAVGAGPIVVDAGRVLTDADVDLLLDLPELFAVADEWLDLPTGAARADAYRTEITAADPTITRCLAEVLDAEDPPIPVYAELATHDGAPVVAYGLVTLDPASGAYARREVWLLEIDGCHVRRFAQR
jgi:hypothetical protein